MYRRPSFSGQVIFMTLELDGFMVFNCNRSCGSIAYLYILLENAADVEILVLRYYLEFLDIAITIIAVMCRNYNDWRNLLVIR
jgi:hypothetical protein